MSVGSVLRIACVALLIGRGLDAVIGDLPLRTILWNQALLEPLVSGVFGVPWENYVRSLLLDRIINTLSTSVGIYFLVVSSLVISGKAKDRLPKLLKIASGILAAVFVLKFMEKSFAIGMLIEHGAQFMAPLAYSWWLSQGRITKQHELAIKIAIACTFLGHALFAVGFHPVPGGFIDMIINVLGFSQEGAKELLLVAGSLDIACAIFIFIPVLDRYALCFMIAWGLITASARVLAHVDLDQFFYTAHQWGLEMIYRLPHGLLPLAVFLVNKNVKISQTDAVH